MPIGQHIGQRIAELRRSQGLTQVQLSRKTRSRVDAQHLSKIERGLYSPKWRTVEIICAALGVTVGELSKTEPAAD